MSLEPITGGLDGAVAPDGRPAPSLPHDVARVVTHLAHLLDARIPLRRDQTIDEYAPEYLGVSPTDVVVTTAELSGFAFQIAALTFTRVMGVHPPDTRPAPPARRRSRVRDDTGSVPVGGHISGPM